MMMSPCSDPQARAHWCPELRNYCGAVVGTDGRIATRFSRDASAKQHLSDRVDPVHGLLTRRGPSSRQYRKHRSKRGATILSTMALGAQTVTAVASQVEHADVDSDVRLLLLLT